MIQECNCSNFDEYSFFKNEKSCKSNDECSRNLSEKYLSNEYLKTKCLNECPLECNRTQYETSVSSSAIVGDSYVDILSRNTNLTQDFINKSIDAETAKNSLARVYIFYESLSYTESNEVAYSTSVLSLAATIGGLLSLFLGGSVLSLFEIVELMIGIYFIYFYDGVSVR